MMQYLLDNQPVAFLIMACLIVIGFWLFVRNKDWPERAHFAQTIEGVAVTLALTLAGLEYVLHHQGDKDRKKQAVIDLLRVSIGAERLDSALAALYDQDPRKVLEMPHEEFDKKIASISDLYWAVGACVTADQCDPETARKVFCFDFKTYEFAYLAVHPKDKRWQDFRDPTLAVYRSCEDRHRFKDSSGKDLPTPQHPPG